jgi:hypothetical protein
MEDICNMTDENTVFDAAFEFNMNGMSPEAAAEAGAHSDSQDARIEELEARNGELGKAVAYATQKFTCQEARIEELYAQAINFRESIRKAALDSEHGHEILDLCWDSYFPERPVAGVHRFVLKETS